MTHEAALVPQLIERTGPHAGRVHVIPYGEHVLGRGREADVQLHDKDISRRHARLEVRADGVLVHDLGSKNGVYAQGRRVLEPILVGHGHAIALGELVLTVSHPASQVSQLLAAAGETTVTTTRTEGDTGPPRRGLLLPLVGVVGFAALAIAALLM